MILNEDKLFNRYSKAGRTVNYADVMTSCRGRSLVDTGKGLTQKANASFQIMKTDVMKARSVIETNC